MTTRDFLLPDLGEGLEDAEVSQWLVAEGDRVELNQTLVEVTTAKATVELPSPWAGAIERLHAAPGDIVAVGSPLVSVRVDDAPEAAPGGRRPVLVGYGVDESADAAPAAQTNSPSTLSSAPTAAATPAVRKLAKDRGVDLSALTGTGPGGRITRDDVERAGGPTGPPRPPRPPRTLRSCPCAACAGSSPSV